MPTFRPLDDQVLVRRPDAPEKMGKLHVPERAKERPLTGEILAVGPGHQQPDGSRSPMQVEPGQTVLFGKYSGTDVELDGVPCLVLRETELLGVIE